MSRGTARELLILTLPTVAFVIGILWLKHRRRKRDSHTDPGGTTTVSIPNGGVVSSEPEAENSLETDEKSDNFESFLSFDEVNNLKEEVPIILKSVQYIEISEDKYKPLDEGEIEAKPVGGILETSFDKTVIDLTEDSVTEETDISGSVSKDTNSVILIEESFSESPLETQEGKKVIEIEIEKEEEKSVEFSEVNYIAREEVEIIKKEDSLVKEVRSLSSVLQESESLDEESIKPSTSKETDNQIVEENQIKTVETKDSKLESVIPSETSFSKKEPSSSELAKGKKKMKKVEQGDLADKLANLELDSMKMGEEKRKESSERDSANHSPSEVMLASPSISNFSDAHSEGSSDSGKGHSDVATSPSRTPAGGSSLAGDLALSVYEFVLPQVIVGRLIGRHGAFLHEIRTSTQTNIFIKRHPDTDKLKVCAIEGTQPDIEKALLKIRNKFPARRFPQLTLEKVTFVNINNAPSLKLEDFHLQLVEGVNNDVILSSLISAAHFFLQQPSHPTYSSLAALNQVMNQVYSMDEAPNLETPIKDAVCAAPTMGGWYRAQIISVDEEGSTSTVRFLDYGGYLLLQSSCLRQIRGDLLNLPFQAVECYLANVAPLDEEGWSKEAKLFVQSLTHGQILQAQIYDYAEDTTPLVYLYSSVGSEVVLINKELVKHGYGVMVNDPEN